MTKAFLYYIRRKAFTIMLSLSNGLTRLNADTEKQVIELVPDVQESALHQTQTHNSKMLHTKKMFYSSSYY